MTTIERRQHRRYDARIEVAFKGKEEFVRCYSQNISRGGIFLQTEELPDPNALIELVLDLQSANPNSETKSLSLTGKVVRLMTVQEGGKTLHNVALQFVNVAPSVQVQLDQLNEDILKNA